MALAMKEDTNEDEYVKTITTLFKVFDLDSGGEIDAREMRELLKMMFDRAPRAAISKAMKEVQKFAGADEGLDLGAFTDAFESASNIIKNWQDVKITPRRASLETSSTSRDKWVQGLEEVSARLEEKKSAPKTVGHCLLYTSPSPRDRQKSRMPSSA